MSTKKRIFPLSIALICVSALYAQTEWRITGDAVSGSSAVLLQNPGNSQEFVFTGKLNSREFKITDGTDTYVVNCGDNDPLEQTLTLRKQDNVSEAGLKIRYVAHGEMFKVTLTATRNGKQIVAERLTPPKQLYIMGGPFSRHDPNWELEDAVEMERDSDNPFIFYYRGEIRYNTFGDERGSIKFLLGRTWGDNYHPAGSANIPLLQAAKMRLNGADTKWEIPANGSGDGYYVIKVNLLDETINVQFGETAINSPARANDNIKVFSDKGKVIIKSKESGRLNVSIFSANGTEVAQKTVVEYAKIALPAGCYVVKAISSDIDEIFTTKVVVSK